MDKLNIIKEFENPLFKRKEIEGIIKRDITPSKNEVMEILCKQYAASEDAVKILGIYGSFGTKESKILACIYNSKEERDKVEKRTKKEIEAEKKEEKKIQGETKESESKSES